MLITIDPGLRHCGCALWKEDGTLDSAELVKSRERTARGPVAWKAMADQVFVRYAGHVSRVVVECPRIYPHTDQHKGDLNDLIELAGVVGALASVFDVNVTHVYPADWKGQVPKEIMNERCLFTLSQAERLQLLHKDHNTLDAVGIGLHAHGRIGKRQVFR